MRIKELFEPSNGVITESMLTENFIADTLKPKIEAIFTRKAKDAPAQIQKYKAAIRKYEQELSALGFDGKEISEIAKRRAAEINPKNFKSKFKSNMKGMLEEIQEGGLVSLTVPAITLLVIIFVNTMMMTIFVSTYGGAIGMAMGATFIAPITEEVGRYLNVKKGRGGQFNVIFNIAEYFIYVSQAAAYGVSVTAMAALRILPVISHTYWTILQRDGIRAGNNKSALAKTGALHALANAAASSGNVVLSLMLYGNIISGSSETDTATLAYENDEIVAFGYVNDKDHKEIRTEIVAREIDIIMVEEGIPTDFLRSHAARIGAKIVVYKDFDEVKSMDRKDKRVAVVLRNAHLNNTFIMGGGKIKRWLQSNMRFKYIRSKTPEVRLEA